MSTAGLAQLGRLGRGHRLLPLPLGAAVLEPDLHLLLRHSKVTGAKHSTMYVQYIGNLLFRPVYEV